MSANSMLNSAAATIITAATVALQSNPPRITLAVRRALFPSAMCCFSKGLVPRFGHPQLPKLLLHRELHSVKCPPQLRGLPANQDGRREGERLFRVDLLSGCLEPLAGRRQHCQQSQQAEGQHVRVVRVALR